MRALLVDDEQMAVSYLQMLLEHIGGIHVIGAHTNPDQAIAMAYELQPDVVFLDIHMHDIDGLQAGLQIQEAVPGVEIVFVTAYNHYAVQAFEMNALDYIMKPLQFERLQKTVRRLKERAGPNKGDGSETPPLICLFNQIGIQGADKEKSAVKWRTAKAREVFAYLFHHRGRWVDKETLIELCWPESETAKGTTQLYTTIYLIRQTLKSSGLDAVSIRSGNLFEGYRIDVGQVHIDTEQWETQLKQLGAPGHHNIDKHEHVLAMYSGTYLGDYDYIWAEPERERLKRLWLNHAREVSNYYVRKKRPGAAIKIYQTIRQLYPYDEENHYTLMKLYASLNNRLGVEEQYGLLVSSLEELDSAPGAEISAWYEGWKRQSNV
ncbi:response regulator [Paenibacillus piri]|uniref:Response regulator n=1 Tax=Paenibacillus piri TaxID=2547395 RepID=A0A4R5KV16_9BACL|nr:response regulator [Paenibacillus piri]TDF98797.1 response regulator [Paenibacillus piri]